VWLDIATELHDDGAGVHAVLRFCFINLRGHRVGISDWRDLLIVLLR
jgi:hypothetical protein